MKRRILATYGSGTYRAVKVNTDRAYLVIHSRTLRTVSRWHTLREAIDAAQELSREGTAR